MKKRPLFLLIMAVMSILTALVASNCSANLDDIREVYGNALLNSTPSSSSNSERLGWCVYLDRPGKKCFSNIPEAVGCPSDAFSGVGIMVPGPVPECFSSSSSGTKGSSSSGTSPSYCLRATEKVCIAPTDGECLPGTTPDYSEECPYSSSSGGGSSSSGGGISSSSGDGSSSSGDGSSSSTSSSSSSGGSSSSGDGSSSPSTSSSSAGSITPDTDVIFDGDYFTDPRDSGGPYKYEVAPAARGGRVWMSENLNYSKGNTIGYCYGIGMTLGVTGASTTGCNSPYGRNYEYEEAIGGNSPQGVCPKGWRIPSVADWQTIGAVAGTTGGYSYMSSGFYVYAGNYNTNPGPPPPNDYPLGWNDRGYNGFYWTSNTKKDWIFMMYRAGTFGFQTRNDAHGPLDQYSEYYSVRCVMDTGAMALCGGSLFNPATQKCNEAVIVPRL